MVCVHGGLDLWRSEDSLVKFILSLYLYMDSGSGNQTQVTGLYSKPLGHLTTL